jgi:hypothetical protein
MRFLSIFCLLREIPTFKEESMKALPRTVRYLVIAIGLMIIVAYALAIETEQGVEVGKDACVDAQGVTRDIYMIIRPEANVSGTQATQITEKLRTFNKSLYKIRKYKKGTVDTTDGDLDDKIMQTGLAVNVDDQAKSTNFTGIALQVGRMFPPLPTLSPSMKTADENSPTPTPSASPEPSASGPSTTMVWETRKKINELEQLLNKYNKK